MSLEALLAENTASMNALALALAAQTAVTERVVAGQAAAMAKLPDGGGTTTRKTKAEKEAEAAAAKAAAGNGEPADTDNGAAAAANASNLPTDVEGVKTVVSAFTSAVEGEARAARVAFLKSIASYFFPDGSKVGSAAFAASPENIKKAVFFINRKKADLDVDFGAEYDFDGAPDQVIAAAESDEFE